METPDSFATVEFLNSTQYIQEENTFLNLFKTAHHITYTILSCKSCRKRIYKNNNDNNEKHNCKNKRRINAAWHALVLKYSLPKVLPKKKNCQNLIVGSKSSVYRKMMKIHWLHTLHVYGTCLFTDNLFKSIVSFLKTKLINPNRNQTTHTFYVKVSSTNYIDLSQLSTILGLC